MNRRDLLRRAALCSPGFFLPGCATVADLALRNQFFIPTNYIAAKLNPYFPFQRGYQDVGQLSLSNPVFSMVPDQNKVRVGLTTGMLAGSRLGELSGIPALGQFAGMSTGGTCQLACGLRYDPASRGIFLKEPVVEKLDIQNFSTALTTPFRQLVNMFGPALLDKHPIHTLDASLASRFLQGMEVQPTGIALKFGA
jgi:hypothetical protein